MTADISRDTFDARKRYAGVVMQQGRVQLDADFNEQVSILLRYMKALAADLYGAHGGPAPDAPHESVSNRFTRYARRWRNGSSSVASRCRSSWRCRRRLDARCSGKPRVDAWR